MGISQNSPFHRAFSDLKILNWFKDFLFHTKNPEDSRFLKPVPRKLIWLNYDSRKNPAIGHLQCEMWSLKSKSMPAVKIWHLTSNFDISDALTHTRLWPRNVWQSNAINVHLYCLDKRAYKKCKVYGVAFILLVPRRHMYHQPLSLEWTLDSVVDIV